MADPKLESLVTDIENAMNVLSDKSTVNDQAQANAQAAIAIATGAAQEKTAAHDDLDSKIDALVAYVTTLK